MSCNYCGKQHINKPCPSGYTTTTTTQDPILCPPKPLCDDLFNSHCIYYSGENIECAGIFFGDDVNTILNNLIAQVQGCCLPTTTTTTTTIDCSDSGGNVDPIYTTTTTCEPLFLICCSSAQTSELQIIEIPCTQQGYMRWEVYQDITDGVAGNAYVWVVANLADIQSLGYSGANIVYTPDWGQVLWASAGEASLVETLLSCNSTIKPSSKCPEPLVTSTTSTSTTSTTSTTTTTTLEPTTTTTTIWCQEYNLYNTTSGPLFYGYINCEGLIISDLVLPSKFCLSIFAQAGSVTVDPGITIGFGECTTSTTSTSTTSTTSTSTTSTSTSTTSTTTTSTTSTTTTTTLDPNACICIVLENTNSTESLDVIITPCGALVEDTITIPANSSEYRCVVDGTSIKPIPEDSPDLNILLCGISCTVDADCDTGCTTTTTSTSTTTTTTTIACDCYEYYNNTGSPATNISYTDCSTGNPIGPIAIDPGQSFCSVGNATGDDVGILIIISFNCCP